MRSVVTIKCGTDGVKLAYDSLLEMGAEEILGQKERILIKPNITVARPDSSGVITKVGIVEGVLRFLSDHGALKKVVIGEGGQIVQARQFAELGRRYGVSLYDFNRDQEVVVDVPNHLSRAKIGLARTVVWCDCIINLPCLKVHKWGCKVTLCMKNMMGCISKNRSFMHEDFDRKLMDLLSVVNKSFVNVIDGIVGLEGDEIYGSAVGAGVVIASRDWVAADAVGAAVMGFQDGEVGHIVLAEKHGFGTGRLANIDVRGDSIESVRRTFKRGAP